MEDTFRGETCLSHLHTFRRSECKTNVFKPSIELCFHKIVESHSHYGQTQEDVNQMKGIFAHLRLHRFVIKDGFYSFNGAGSTSFLMQDLATRV